MSVISVGSCCSRVSEPITVTEERVSLTVSTPRVDVTTRGSMVSEATWVDESSASDGVAAAAAAIQKTSRFVVIKQCPLWPTVLPRTAKVWALRKRAQGQAAEGNRLMGHSFNRGRSSQPAVAHRNTWRSFQAGLRADERTCWFGTTAFPCFCGHSGVMAVFDSITVAGAAPDSPLSEKGTPASRFIPDQKLTGTPEGV